MKYQLSNTEREYLGLDPIESSWDFVKFNGDKYRPDSILIYDGNVIKRHIISTENTYREYQYDDLTKERKILLPKTKRGKEKKLTPSTFEKLTPKGVYFNYGSEKVEIASWTTQTEFYSTRMESIKIPTIEDFKLWLKKYIAETTDANKRDLVAFKSAKRRNIKSKKGDVFAFKIGRNNYGYGQVVEDIYALRKALPENHGLNNLMGKPLLVRLFHYVSSGIEKDIRFLEELKTTPSQYIFDNHIFYGENPIVGNFEIPESELDFPISYGKVLYAAPYVYLQWGVLHQQKNISAYNKHLARVNEFVSEDSPSYIINNPYAKNSIGFQLYIDEETITDCIRQNSNEPYWNQRISGMKIDLRNPINKEIRLELFEEFKIDGARFFIGDEE